MTGMPSQSGSAGKPEQRFEILSEEQLHDLPRPRFLIDGILPEQSLVVLYAPPGSGKSFIALSMAYAISGGEDWLGRGTRKGAAVYIAGEGLYGLNCRSQGIRKHSGIEGPREVYFCADPVNLLSEDDVMEFVKAVRSSGCEPSLIVVDTLARCFVGGDENSAREMGTAIQSMDMLRLKLGSTVLVVHHTNKKGYSERGSTALRGAADAMFGIDRKDPDKSGLLEYAKFSCEKIKDFEPFESISLDFVKVDLGDLGSTLVVTDGGEELTALLDSIKANRNTEDCVKLLADEFGKDGAAHTEWKKRYIAKNMGSESKFNRAIKKAIEVNAVRKTGKGKGARYVAIEAGSVSDQYHDTNMTPDTDKAAEGISSRPPQGRDTETDRDGTEMESEESAEGTQNSFNNGLKLVICQSGPVFPGIARPGKETVRVVFDAGQPESKPQ